MDVKVNLPVTEKVKLSVRDLNFYYGGFHALKRINLDIPENKVTAFIGPSGCGKSTLLRTFNRMFELYPEQRAEGEILLDGANILNSKDDVSLLRAKAMGFLQKLAADDTKGGASAAEARELADAIAALPRLRLRGLMCMLPEGLDAAQQRARFGAVRDLYEQLRREGAALDTLSMGMSGDFEAAIASGSTLVRIGTALFGARGARIS